MDKTYIKETANKFLEQIYGKGSTFRDGQYEAIEATLVNKKTLVVQKTGWGKSLVYFLCTKIFREQNRGVTFVISPLLVLMENQTDAANKMNLVTKTLNSTTKDDHEKIIADIVANKVDLVFITPETLFNKNVQSALKDINIGLFVIDEAHCISDWGHDFRLKYAKLYKILDVLPETVPVLATTATANDRVVDDLKTQLGDNVFVSRGDLLRKSLSIQILNLTSTAKRYAWILENINKLEGSGIIYCLTQRDCENVTKFLVSHNIKAKSYFSRDKKDEELNSEAEEAFMRNEIKVIVATIKLGMGYDKGDIAFVIHYQAPSNVVSYYQQIGRAGRNIDRAYTFLMTGSEDEDIQNYFIESAFPAEDEYGEILNYIFANTDDGVSLGMITSNVNLRNSRIEKILMFLENDGYISKDYNTKKRTFLYHSLPKQFIYDIDKYYAVTKMRKAEQSMMKELFNTSECYSKFVVNCLDDKTTDVCGICSNCLGHEEFPLTVSAENLEIATAYLEQLFLTITPRRKWATTSLTGQTKIDNINETGICLSKYGDAKYGTLVKNDKYSNVTKFCDELENKAVEFLKGYMAENDIKAITYVPSLRTQLVFDFAKRIANKCGVLCLTLLSKTDAKQQKTMENSSYQCENALRSFHFDNANDVVVPENILLIDDIIDSKWTLTVCGDLLMNNGVSKVYPFALADSSYNKE